jgi:HD-like signal output (HDOD) protein
MPTADSLFPGVPAELKQRLKTAVGTLNMLPAVAVQALQIANNPDCDLGKLAGVIQRDLKLTTMILRMANSALFSPPKPIASLHHAVLTIGLRRCRDFIVVSFRSRWMTPASFPRSQSGLLAICSA